MAVARLALAAPRTAESLPAFAPERPPFRPAVQARSGFERAAWCALLKEVFLTMRTV
ncbi:MAG: hypothetical protein NZ523_01815 [Elioraea sp.]|nr:hypothetical protein [Elioraea sp.]